MPLCNVGSDGTHGLIDWASFVPGCQGTFKLAAYQNDKQAY